MAKTFGYYRSDKKEKISHQNGLNSKEISQYFRNVTKFLVPLGIHGDENDVLHSSFSCLRPLTVPNPLANVDDIDKICTHRL
ncbi:unnamed protein product [Allacma fusca]|uniref:Uncharacterized protein n=1 Tax=Allacma fusca TaxID=39272 RepID=A0A8J2JK92_9HEXA|nr:unnamed protein product [Allacma fusca]